MPSVVLIGDSIRLGYQPFVREILSGEADVWGPKENGGTSVNVLAHLEPWAISREADVIHLNCGLHDLKRLADPARPDVGLDAYRDNVRTILTTLGERTRSRIVWATTTPVNARWHEEQKRFVRLEVDVAAYNEAAVAVATELGLPVDDLCAAVEAAGRDALLGPDGVHFKEEGYRLLAETVAESVRLAWGGETR